MHPLFSAAAKAIESLFVPGMFGVFIYSIIVTLLALFSFFLFASGVSIMIGAQMDSGAVGVIGTLGAGFLAWLLFPAIMPVIVNFFDDRIATLIEKKDYPNTLPRSPDFWPELWHDSKFTLFALTINIVVFPLYFFPLLGQILFFLVNGYLLGREFFVTVAKRYMPIAEAIQLRKQHRMRVLIAGMALVLAAVTPIVNLFAPFWGIALMLHLYHRLAKPVELLAPK